MDCGKEFYVEEKDIVFFICSECMIKKENEDLWLKETKE